MLLSFLFLVVVEFSPFLFHLFCLRLCCCSQAQLINEELVVFVVATTGQGDEPDNMKVSSNLSQSY